MSSSTGQPPVEPKLTDGKGVKRAPERDSSACRLGEAKEETESSTIAPPTKMVKISKEPPKATTTESPAESPVDATVAVGKDETSVKRELTDSERIEEEALRELGLAVGTRMEVMWILEEEEKSTEKWWGCSLAGAVPGQRDEEGHPVFTLHYDAYEAFEEVDHNVSFVDKYRLIHLEDGAEMMWKKDGEEMDREAVMASLADEAVDLQEVVRAQEQDEAEAGEESTERRGMRELARLPFHQQIAMAAGFRRMTDVVKEHLRAKMAKQDGGEVVVSAEDVHNMFREVRAGGPGEHGI